MTQRATLAFLSILAIASAAAAQTKVSGTLQCGKADPSYTLEVGDHAGHVWTLTKTACTWTKPIEIGGVQAKDGVSAGSGDVSGDKQIEHGFHVDTMSNGDKLYVRYSGTTKLKDGAPVTIEGTYTFAGGTGKMKGVKGKGTYKGGAPNADGAIAFAIEGTYEMSK